MGTRLAETLVKEGHAYGYTLTVWGAGGLLIHRYGAPGLWEVVGYVLGAVVGFGALAWVAFDGLADRATPDRESVRAASMIHVLSTLSALGVAGLLVHLPGIPPVGTFPLVGFGATVTYNLLLQAERLLPERLS